MNITLNQLRAFERIVRLGSFSGAAKELRLTQPSISQRIRELESTLDTSLFLRNGPRIKPTAEAHALLAYADRVLETEIEMRERLPLARPAARPAADRRQRELRADLHGRDVPAA